MFCQNINYLTIVLFLALIFLIVYSLPKNSKENFEDNNIDRYKLYFIVLQKDKERVEHIKNLIKKFNIQNYEIISAVDGSKLNMGELIKSNYITLEKIDKMRKGAIGCAMSHILLWERLQKENNNISIIFEDDVYFSKDFYIKLKNYINNLPKDFDISQLLIHDLQRKYFPISNNVNKYVKEGYPQYGTVGYIISKKGIKKLLNKCKPIYTPIDNMIMNNIKNKYIISYIPKEEIIHMPYKMKSNIW
jgi:glycosyl transferase family 25